ncbi:MAG TPA: C4-dicarboxylate ABC transporter substrate-binding protein, partial [Synergistaceae bacterium]|nr:C4-dicarboxylate ABC transporter substrate-binding protein [Synergistaceae bacterium]
MRRVMVCVFLGVLSLMTVLLPGCAAAAPEMTLRFAGQFPEGHVATVLMRQVAEEVLEKTGGRIAVQIFPNNELGDYTLVYEELIRGSIDMAAITVPSQFDPRLEIAYMNCVVRTFDDARKFFARDGWLFRKMDELHTRLGVKLLAFQIEGFIGIGSTKP